MNTYVPSSAEEKRLMLEALGMKDADELYADIPEKIKIKHLSLPEGISEQELSEKAEALCRKNKVYTAIFRGAGAYNHYIPAIVRSVISKEEFVTAYTPYQAEISQGILQSIFEYQTMICALTGLDVSNASVYDGASAAAEAVAACRERKKNKALVSSLLNPMVISTVETYCKANGMTVELIPGKDGVTDTDALTSALDDTTACVLTAQVNFLGCIEDCRIASDAAHAAGAKYIMYINPIAAAILSSAGECGADLACGEGQPLGMPLSFGGPYLGFMAARKELVRKLPGRIVGQTLDSDGNRAFVLTLQAREQHIRREKASSNICSNEALCALCAACYMSAMGKKGMRRAATVSLSNAHYLAKALDSLGFKRIYSSEFFNEFLTSCPVNSDELMKKLDCEGILGGLPTKGGILWCTTECNSREQIDRLLKICGEATK